MESNTKEHIEMLSFRCRKGEKDMIIRASNALYGPRKLSLFIRRAVLAMINDTMAMTLKDDIGDDK